MTWIALILGNLEWVIAGIAGLAALWFGWRSKQHEREANRAQHQVEVLKRQHERQAGTRQAEREAAKAEDKADARLEAQKRGGNFDGYFGDPRL